MKSITIHGIEPKMDQLIRKRSKELGLSQNRTIKRLLEESLGLSEIEADHRKEFQDLCGVISPQEKREFKQRIKDLETVDEADWR